MTNNKLFVLKASLLSLFTILVASCGGCGHNDNTDTPTLPLGTGKLLLSNPTQPDQPIALVNIQYASAPSDSALQQGQKDQGGVTVTNSKGEFKYGTAETVSFTLFNTPFTDIPAKANITQDDLAAAYCRQSEKPAACPYAVTKNLQRLLLSVDDNEDYTNGISIMAAYQQKEPPAKLDSSIEQFELALGKALLLQGRKLAALYKPSLGINLEAPQPEADEVGGQPVPFVDLFRVSRPFAEYSCTDISYDEQGWPMVIPPSCDTQKHPVLRVPSWATSIMLRYVPYGSIPVGKYTVLYEGSGNIQYSGIASKIPTESSPGRDMIEITPDLIRKRNASGLRVQIKSIDHQNPVRNLRIVMPGGTCEGNPFIRVDSAEQCAGKPFLSFVDTLAQNRNAIVFNPDYLRFLKDFKVIRMMNFMEASPRNPCYDLEDEAYTTCLLQPFTWDMRAKMDDASWGGSARTPLLERYARGVPLEVAVALANQLGRDPWFNIPHNATEEYIKNYASYVYEHLDPKLKAYVEYSNEPWNGIFWAALYMREKGKDLDSNPYRAGYQYYADRAVEIFNQWFTIFGGAERLVRVLNTYHPDEWMTRNMLAHNGNAQFVDAIASAPYFHGCWNRSSHAVCADEEKIPLVMSQVTSLDDIFSVIDNVNDPYGIEQVSKINTEKQVKATTEYGVQLITYEGGQHLTVNWGDGEVSAKRKSHLLDLFQAANRDARMAARYSQLLNNWKNAGGTLFTLYTLPQSYHKFGAFGIKEQLNQTRFDAPKYDMSMQFQEVTGSCWWKKWKNCAQ